MALSNWDTMAFDENGEPTNGVIEGFAEGSACEIYKNWLYVRDTKMWTKDRHYIEPTIAKIEEGKVEVSDFNIEASRGPQNSIFVLVTSIRYKKQKEGQPYQPPEIRRLGGIGCYGYGNPPYNDVRKQHNLGEEWIGWCVGYGSDGTHSFTYFNNNTKELKEVPIEDWDESYESQWVGVLPDTLKEFVLWLKKNDEYTENDENEYTAWVNKIASSQGLRFNQGDMFFHQNAGTELCATPVGEQTTPVMENIATAMSGTVKKPAKKPAKIGKRSKKS
jgi:hypothetical protein